MGVEKLLNGWESASALVLDPEVGTLRLALGPVVCAALDDPDVVEILLNVDGKLWVERRSNGRNMLGGTITAEEGERVIRTVGKLLKVDVHRGRPLLSAELPGSGDRFDGVLPPVAANPAFALRKRFLGLVSLESYVDGGMMTAAQAALLRRAVRERQNILIGGGSGTGKTTLANALLAEMVEKTEGVLVLEDRNELQCTARHQVTLRTGRAGGSMTELVCAAVRLRPDRVVMGEVRGREARYILTLWNKSRPGGFTTIHGGSSQGALLRLEQLISPELDQTSRALIAETIHLVVYMAGHDSARRVGRVDRVIGFDKAGYQLVDAVFEAALAPPHTSSYA